MTVFHKMTDWNKRIADLRQTAKDNPKPKDISDWVKEIMKHAGKENIEKRRQILALVPENLRAHVAGRVELEFEKMVKKVK